MIRGNKLTLGIFTLAAALLAGQQVFAGNGGNHSNSHNNHGNWHNNNHDKKVVVKIHGGSWQNHNHNWNHNHNHNHSPFHGHHGKMQPRPGQGYIYCVEVRQPERYHDMFWHQVKCFPSQYEAERFAASLRNKSYQQDYLVRVLKRSQNYGG